MQCVFQTSRVPIPTPQQQLVGKPTVLAAQTHPGYLAQSHECADWEVFGFVWSLLVKPFCVRTYDVRLFFFFTLSNASDLETTLLL